MCPPRRARAPRGRARYHLTASSGSPLSRKQRPSIEQQSTRWRGVLGGDLELADRLVEEPHLAVGDAEVEVGVVVGRREVLGDALLEPFDDLLERLLGRRHERVLAAAGRGPPAKAPARARRRGRRSRPPRRTRCCRLAARRLPRAVAVRLVEPAHAARCRPGSGQARAGCLRGRRMPAAGAGRTGSPPRTGSQSKSSLSIIAPISSGLNITGAAERPAGRRLGAAGGGGGAAPTEIGAAGGGGRRGAAGGRPLGAWARADRAAPGRSPRKSACAAAARRRRRRREAAGASGAARDRTSATPRRGRCAGAAASATPPSMSGRSTRPGLRSSSTGEPRTLDGGSADAGAEAERAPARRTCGPATTRSPSRR